ncbi:zf-CCHC domain-containing protein [Tanacetum coccineum]
MEKDSKIYKGKKESAKSIALKAKKESSNDETLTFERDEEEYVMASFRKRDDKKGKSDRKCFRCGDPNHLIGDCPKPPQNKDQKAFVGGCWSDSENEAEVKTNDETCLMAQSSNEVTLDSSYYSDNASSFDDDRDGSTIKADGSTIAGSVDPSTSQKVAEHVLSPPKSSRSNFVIVRKKLIHNKIEESKKWSLKSTLKNGLGYAKTLSSSNVTPTPVLNEIIALSGETEIPKVMEIFFEQQIAEDAVNSFLIDWITN